MTHVLCYLFLFYLFVETINPVFNLFFLFSIIEHKSNILNYSFFFLCIQTLYILTLLSTGAMFDSKLKFRFQIFDKNRFSKDTLMGEGEFNVMPIIRSSIGGPTTKPTEHTITLTKTKPYNQVKSPKNRDTKPMTPIVTDSAEPSKLKKVTGKLWIEFHFQPHLPGSGSEEIARTQSGGRGGLGALLGVVAETLHTMELDSNIRATHFVILPSR